MIGLGGVSSVDTCVRGARVTYIPYDDLLARLRLESAPCCAAKPASEIPSTASREPVVVARSSLIRSGVISIQILVEWTAFGGARSPRETATEAASESTTETASEPTARSPTET